jgi:hypothetical protein
MNSKMNSRISTKLKSFFSSILTKIAYLLLFFILVYIIVILNPVFDGVKKGFHEVWLNIKDTWYIFILKGILKVIFVIFFWVWSISISVFISWLIILIPAVSVNKILNRKSIEDSVPYFTLSPLNSIEIISTVFNLGIFTFTFVVVFFRFFWNFVMSIDYSFS